MRDLVIGLLKEKGIKDYCVYDELRESAELFFIRKNIDLARGKEARELKLTVYRDFERGEKKYRGSSSVYIYPEYDAARISGLIDEAYSSALYVENPYFELPEGTREERIEAESDLKEGTLTDNAVSMAAALYEADCVSGAWVNSSEFFAEKKTVNILTSAGTDVSYVKFNVNGEFVTQSREGEDAELHWTFEYDSLARDAIRQKCGQALKTVRDRALAVKAPADLSGFPVILCDGALGDFLGFYLDRANAGMIYPGYSDYKADLDVFGGAKGEKPDIVMLPDAPYSAEGVRTKEHTLLENGVVKNLHGNVMYSSYVGIPQIGSYGRLRCLNGGTPLDELKKEPCIMVKSFSDFQVDKMDGYFGGEFRLAYLYDGGKERILTGGTVSGNIFEAQTKLKFSSERYADALYEGPAAVRIG
ncbi:MAG: metallopeptidase TldD-related protein [Butyrivibrio sp.]|nr:metallopeptidase TldD-related protein [Butyrivibrio sp.]